MLRRMNTTRGLTIAVLCAVGLSGCAYAGHRANDAKDIFTATVGGGWGVCAQAGPLATGLEAIFEGIGMRSGYVGEHDPGHFSRGVDGGFPVYQRSIGWTNEEIVRRGKEYETDTYAVIIPIPKCTAGEKGKPVIPSCLTRVEVAGGLFFTIRLGINPGELLDFLLGFAGLDILLDDVEAKAGAGPETAPGAST